jgi:hypothetical protein
MSAVVLESLLSIVFGASAVVDLLKENTPTWIVLTETFVSALSAFFAFMSWRKYRSAGSN